MRPFQAVPLALAVCSAPYRNDRKTCLLCDAGGPPKNGSPKNGLIYSQTISPSLVTSNSRPNDVTHARRKEVPGWLILVLPYDPVGRRTDLGNTRIGQRVVEAVNAIVKDQDVAVRQAGRRVLDGHGRRPEFPQDLPGRSRDADNRRCWPIARQDIAVLQFLHAVPLCPQRPRRLHFGDAVGLGVEMLPSPPLPDRLAGRRGSPRPGNRSTSSLHRHPGALRIGRIA